MIDLARNTELEKYLQQLLGQELTSFLSARPEAVAVRVNRLKSDADTFEQRLATLGLSYKRTEDRRLILVHPRIYVRVRVGTSCNSFLIDKSHRVPRSNRWEQVQLFPPGFLATVYPD